MSLRGSVVAGGSSTNDYGLIAGSAGRAGTGGVQNTFAQAAGQVPYLPQVPALPGPIIQTVTVVTTLYPWVFYISSSSLAFVFGVFTAIVTMYAVLQTCGLGANYVCCRPCVACSASLFADVHKTQQDDLWTRARARQPLAYWVVWAIWWLIESVVRIFYGTCLLAFAVLANFGAIGTLLGFAFFSALLAAHYVGLFNVTAYTTDSLGTVWNLGAGVWNVALQLSNVLLVSWNLGWYWTIELFRLFIILFDVSTLSDAASGANRGVGDATANFFQGNSPELLQLGNVLGRRRRFLQSAAGNPNGLGGITGGGDDVVAATSSPTTPFATSAFADYDAGPDLTAFLIIIRAFMQAYALAASFLFFIAFNVIRLILVLFLPVLEYIGDFVLMFSGAASCVMSNPVCGLLEGIEAGSEFLRHGYNTIIADPLSNGPLHIDIHWNTPLQVACVQANFGTSTPCNCAAASSGIYSNLAPCSTVSYTCFFDATTNEWVESREQNGNSVVASRTAVKPSSCPTTRRALGDALGVLETHDHNGCFGLCVNSTRFKSCPLDHPGVVFWTGETCAHDAATRRSLRAERDLVPVHHADDLLRKTFGNSAEFKVQDETAKKAAEEALAAKRARASASSSSNNGGGAGATHTGSEAESALRSEVGARTSLEFGSFVCSIAQPVDSDDEVAKYVRQRCVDRLATARTLRDADIPTAARKYVHSMSGIANANANSATLHGRSGAQVDAENDSVGEEARRRVARLAAAGVRASEVLRSRWRRAMHKTRTPFERVRRVLEVSREAWNAEDAPAVMDVLREELGIKSVHAPHLYAAQATGHFLTRALHVFHEHAAAEARRRDKRARAWGVESDAGLVRHYADWVDSVSRNDADGGAERRRRLLEVTRSPTTPPTLTKLGVFVDKSCPNGYICPGNGPCVAFPQKNTCPEPTYWTFGSTVQWGALQAELWLQGLSIYAIFADTAECLDAIDANPSINPMSFENVIKLNNCPECRFCLPLLRELPFPTLPATEFDFITTAGELCTGLTDSTSTVPSCDCPAYWEGMFDTSPLWFLNVPYYVLVLLHNGALDFWFWFTLAFTRGTWWDSFWQMMWTPAVQLGVPVWVQFLFGDQNQGGTLNQQIFCASLNAYAMLVLVWLILIYTLMIQTLFWQLALVLYGAVELVEFWVDYIIEALLVRRASGPNGEKTDAARRAARDMLKARRDERSRVLSRWLTRLVDGVHRFTTGAKVSRDPLVFEVMEQSFMKIGAKINDTNARIDRLYADMGLIVDNDEGDAEREAPQTQDIKRPLLSQPQQPSESGSGSANTKKTT